MKKKIMTEILKFPNLPEGPKRIERVVNFDGQLYPNQIIKDVINSALADILDLHSDVIPPLSEPPKEIEGDFGLVCFPLAKQLRKKPYEIVQNLATNLALPESAMVTEVKAAGSYLNFSLDYKRYGKEVLNQVLVRKENYGAENLGNGEVAVIDMSSPNIAKPMSVGHLRSTVIGHSLARILEYTGHKVIKDNHLGDWGAQFGMLLRAYELWGDETPELHEVGKEVEGLLKLYVRIHDEIDRSKGQERERMRNLINEKGFSAIDGFEVAYKRALTESGSEEQALEEALTALTPETELEKAGKEWFRKLESGDEQAKEQWQWVAGLSMKEFEEVYRLLGVDFDYALGESFFSPMMADVVVRLKNQPFVKVEDGTVVADLEDKNLGKMAIQAKDGRSLYVTRDLAAAMFRQEVFNPGKVLYVVGGDQKYYFSQWFEILRKMGYPVADKCRHIYFGMMKLPEGKMSTRKGRVIFLKDVIEEGIRRAEQTIAEKNPDLAADSEKAGETARKVAVGAIIWSDLGKDMKRDIIFNWDEMLSFDGYSAPYVQYAYARGRSILRKATELGLTRETWGIKIEVPEEKKLIKLMAEFPEKVKLASITYNPSVIAEYVHGLAQAFNLFYKKWSVLSVENEETKQTRLKLVAATTQVIKNALYLLGIEIPEEM